MTIKQYANAACSNSIRAVAGGGNNSPTILNNIDYITISTLCNAVNFGDLTGIGSYNSGLSSPTRGIFGGGENTSLIDVIQYISFATQGDAVDFGNLSAARNSTAGISNSNGGL